MQWTLGLTQLLPRFEGRLFSAEDVSQGKPAPDLFLFAAKRMGYDPADCIVIEDSIPGINAALAAGMRVCNFANAVDRGTVRFTTMSDLPSILHTLVPF